MFILVSSRESNPMPETWPSWLCWLSWTNGRIVIGQHVTDRKLVGLIDSMCLGGWTLRERARHSSSQWIGGGQTCASAFPGVFGGQCLHVNGSKLTPPKVSWILCLPWRGSCSPGLQLVPLRGPQPLARDGLCDPTGGLDSDAAAGVHSPHCDLLTGEQQASFPSTSPHLAQGLAQGRRPLCLSGKRGAGGNGLL